MAPLTKKFAVGLVVVGFLALVTVLAVLTHGGNLVVLNPKGTIAAQQMNLIVMAAALSLVVIVPVFIMTFSIAYKYRATNTKAIYTPDWDHSRLAETIWWLVPLLLISILSVIIWVSSHQLDPYKPLTSTVKPITVQVVALPWKWLFLYPQLGIASLNALQLPVNTPINFEITSDAPMNSFWIPQLSGQVYAMSGMTTQLHIMATETGAYRGSSANLSGVGFAGMNFMAKVTSAAQFNAWVASVRHTSGKLDHTEYTILAKPSQNDPAITYTLPDANLYDETVMHYMTPPTSNNQDDMSGMDMN